MRRGEISTVQYSKEKQNGVVWRGKKTKVLGIWFMSGATKETLGSRGGCKGWLALLLSSAVAPPVVVRGVAWRVFLAGGHPIFSGRDLRAELPSNRRRGNS